MASTAEKIEITYKHRRTVGRHHKTREAESGISEFLVYKYLGGSLRREEVGRAPKKEGDDQTRGW